MTTQEAARVFGAQFYLPNPDGSAAMCYRFHPIEINDGSVYHSLQYLSFANIWIASADARKASFVKRLIQI